MENGASRYSWLGKTWTQVVRDGAVMVVTDQGEIATTDEIMRALYKGEAVTVRDKAEPKAGEHDEAGAARAKAKIEAARTAGIAVPASKADGLFYDVGTAVMLESWASERKDFEAMPAASEVIPTVRAQIKAELRQDVEHAAWDLRVSKSTGKVGDPKQPSAEAMVPTRRALQGFYSRSGVGQVPDHWPTDIRAGAVNALCERFAKERPPSLLVNGDDPRVVLRVQRARGRAFACVSPTYAAFDGDLVLEALLDAVPRGARVSVDYDPDAARGRVEIVTLQEERPVVGEPFRTSFTVGWDDTGAGSIWGDGGLFSARCLNLTRIWTSAGTFRIRHAGTVRNLAHRFDREFDRVAQVVHGFAAQYGKAASEELTNEEKLDSAEFIQGVYRSLLQRELVPVRGRREEAVGALAAQFFADENHAGLTRAGVTNGVTRYAHRANADPWQRDELERAAGRILSGAVGLGYLAREAA